MEGFRAVSGSLHHLGDRVRGRRIKRPCGGRKSNRALPSSRVWDAVGQLRQGEQSGKMGSTLSSRERDADNLFLDASCPVLFRTPWPDWCRLAYLVTRGEKSLVDSVPYYASVPS